MACEGDLCSDCKCVSFPGRCIQAVAKHLNSLRKMDSIYLLQGEELNTVCQGKVRCDSEYSNKQTNQF